MTISQEDVEHIAGLAGLALDPDTLPELAKQIGQILDYVSQLETVDLADPANPRAYPGPRQPLREDRAVPTPLAIPLQELAPAFRDGLFLVPRLIGTGTEDATPDGAEG